MYSSDGSNKAVVCKHRKEVWGWPAICQRVERFEVFTETKQNPQKNQLALKWLAKMCFLGMERIWMLIGKSILDSRWTVIVIFLQHNVTASLEHSSVELEIRSKLQNAKSLFLHKYLHHQYLFAVQIPGKLTVGFHFSQETTRPIFRFCFAVEEPLGHFTYRLLNYKPKLASRITLWLVCQAQSGLHHSGIHSSHGRQVVVAQLKSSLYGKGESALAEASRQLGSCLEGSVQ